MYTAEEKAFFLEQGYLHARSVLTGDYLEHIRSEFDRVWEAEKPKVNQHRLLKYQTFLDLIAHPPILERHKAIFGEQVQLLQYDFLRQGPRSDFPERAWHRDFTFPGERPLSINTILYLDDMTEEVGPTRVVPGTHRGESWPPHAQAHDPLPGEVAVYAEAGDAVFINSAIWHTGGRNRGAGLRRGIYLYYGYWWLKRYESETALPWQAFENASEQRLRLLGVKMPAHDIHMY
ncbi:MAG TPA: phytanoyl-CoA dioxygenase family protein [Chthonomonadaceae bacterium]|nr:phytanoyl-CoA dioxygenase family protein [Chthonomonadaceae bacterium]